MDAQTIAIYCLCDALMRALHHVDHPQREMTDAEVMKTAISAVLYFGDNFECTRRLLHDHGYIPKMLEKSGFTRRLHAIADLVESLFGLFTEAWKDLGTQLGSV